MSKLVDEKRVNELVELSMKEFPDDDKCFLWVCAVDYVMREEMKIEINEEELQKTVDEIYNIENNMFMSVLV
jgi:hypothetical protein